MTKKVRSVCRGCGDEVIRRSSSGKSDPITCLKSGVEPGDHCWLKTNRELATICLESMTYFRGPSTMSVAEKNQAIRDVFEKMLLGGFPLQTYLIGLGSERRQALFATAAPRLRQYLVATLGSLDQGAPKKQTPVISYDDLPPDLVEGLRSYEARVRSRLSRLEKNGHTRHVHYVRRRMNEPVRYARLLAELGVTRWSTATQSHRIKFAKRFPKHSVVNLAAFLRHIAGANLFAKKGAVGASKKKSANLLNSTKIPEIYSPAQLTAKLKAARSELSPEEYALYWLVGRLGMTAKAAKDLTLDCVHVNEAGKTIVRPAEGWLEVPKSLAGTFQKLAKAANPKWPFESPETGMAIPVMALAADTEYHLTRIFRGDSKKLRLSALYAALRSGIHDRTTLKAMMGASLKTLAKLEFLMAADMHHVVDTDIINARNAVILGHG